MLYPAPCRADIIGDNQILKDSEVCFRIAPTIKDFKIIEAYIGCGIKNAREYDATNKKIKDCSRTLLIEDDSVRIYFEPGEVGKFKFEDLTLLLQDNKNNLYFIDTTFNYQVESLESESKP